MTAKATNTNAIDSLIRKTSYAITAHHPRNHDRKHRRNNHRYLSGVGLGVISETNDPSNDDCGMIKKVFPTVSVLPIVQSKQQYPQQA